MTYLTNLRHFYATSLQLASMYYSNITHVPDFDVSFTHCEL